MPQDFDVVVCGSCVVDVLVRPVPLDSPIGGGQLVRTEPLLLTTGGIVSNAGITLARLGMRAAAFTYVGDDEWASIIRTRYTDEGLDASHLVTHNSAPTSTTAVLIDPSGERSFMHAVGARKLLDKQVFLANLDFFARSRVMLLGYYSLLTKSAERSCRGARRDSRDRLPNRTRCRGRWRHHGTAGRNACRTSITMCPASRKPRIKPARAIHSGSSPPTAQPARQDYSA